MLLNRIRKTVKFELGGIRMSRVRFLMGTHGKSLFLHRAQNLKDQIADIKELCEHMKLE